jgi:hypothetical protein
MVTPEYVCSKVSPACGIRAIDLSHINHKLKRLAYLVEVIVKSTALGTMDDAMCLGYPRDHVSRVRGSEVSCLRVPVHGSFQYSMNQSQIAFLSE